MPSQPSKFRRIVLIMTDTQRTDLLGCYGNPAMRTPHLDRFAADSVRFDRAYTCQPVCGPARAALFTGTFPHSCGSWSNSMPLGDNVKTIGQRLRDNGFHTAYIGKWHLDGGDYFGLGRCPDGWDRAFWYDMHTYLEDLTPEQRLLSRQTRANHDPGITAEMTFGHRCSSRAIDFLTRHSDEDFFLVVSYDEPHGPYLCPTPYAGMHKDSCRPQAANTADPLTDKPEHHRAWAANAKGQAPVPTDYLDCNSFIDSEIGRVLAAIDQYAPDAMVIYTSDHGDHLGAHGLDNKGASMYEEITHVPLLIRHPGVTPAGTACPHPVSHIDLAPTILTAAGLPIPRLLEGRDLSAALADPQCRVNEAVFMEFGRYEIDHDGFGGFQPIRAVFDGRYKLVVNLLSTDELYDVHGDPGELTNLIGSSAHITIRNALHDRLLDWMNRTRDPFRGYYWERRPWRTDARPATWDHTGYTRQRENEEYEPRQLDYNTGLPMKEATRRKG